VKLHWIIPLTVDATFQFTSKNEMARSFRSCGHDITTTVAYVNDKTVMDGFTHVDYVHVPAGSLFSKIRLHWKMLESTWKMNADVVMFGFQSAHLIPLAWLFRCGRNRPKLVMDIRTVPVDVRKGIKGKLDLWRYRFSLYMANWFCDGVTVITPMLGDTVRPYLKRLKNKMGVWTSGVHLEHFERAGKDRRQELGIEGKQVLLYHGVLSPNRGLQNALRAFDSLKEKFPDLFFLFVGDGDGRIELEQLAKDLGLNDRVIFTGKVPYVQVSEYIRSANMAILPFPDITWWAVSSPIKLMEYLATGISIIATNIDAHRWVVEKTGGAILAVDDQPASLAKSIEAVLVEGVEAAAPEKLEATISWNKQAKELLRFVEGL